MFSVASLLALLVLSVTGSSVEVRNSPITLPMTRRLTFSNVTDLLRHDEALVAALTEYSTHGRRGFVPLTNFDGSYIVSVGIGNPTTMYHLVVDSTSAFTWVGASTTYVSRTGISSEEQVTYNYGTGTFKGILYQDSMTFGTEELSINRMQFGVASTLEKIFDFNFDGILGIGPRGLTRSIMNSPEAPEALLPTVTDCLVQQNAIREPLVGIFFKPVGAHPIPHGHGEISFGEPDKTK